MKKFALASVAALCAAALCLPAQATTVNSNQFKVIINLTPACGISSQPTDMTFNYTGGQNTAVNATSSFQVTCTQGMGITSMTLDVPAGGWSAAPVLYTDAAVNLQYTLTMGSVANPVPTLGTGTAQTVDIQGVMAAGQGGKCIAAGNCAGTTQNSTTFRTVQITF